MHTALCPSCLRPALPVVLLIAALTLIAAIGRGIQAGEGRTPLYLATGFPTDPSVRVREGEPCTRGLHEGSWTNWIVWREACELLPGASAFGCGGPPRRHWIFGPRALACGAKRLDTAAIRVAAKGGLAFAGDSIMRYIFVALLRAADIEVPVFERHADALAELPDGTPIHFLWRPYPHELLAQAQRWANGSDPAPSAAITSSCLWHMLWTHSAEEFGREMALLRKPLRKLERQGKTRVIVSSCTTVYPQLMPNPNKVGKLTPQTRDAYDAALRSNAVLGGQPVLDLAALTAACGIGCSLDGVHFDEALNDAALQILLLLLGETRKG